MSGVRMTAQWRGMYPMVTHSRAWNVPGWTTCIKKCSELTWTVVPEIGWTPFGLSSAQLHPSLSPMVCHRLLAWPCHVPVTFPWVWGINLSGNNKRRSRGNPQVQPPMGCHTEHTHGNSWRNISLGLAWFRQTRAMCTDLCNGEWTWINHQEGENGAFLAALNILFQEVEQKSRWLSWRLQNPRIQANCDW